MPARRIDLPSALASDPFTVAKARAAGVLPTRLRHSSLAVPTRGLRAHHRPTTLVEHCATLALALPRPFAYSHATAAELHGIPLPETWRIGDPVFTIRPTAAAPIRRPEVRGHRGLEGRHTTQLRTMPVTGLLHTWCDLGHVLELLDLVVAGDWVLNKCPGGLVDLIEAVAARAGHRGKRRLRAALPLMRLGSGSPMETRARLVFLAAGLPEPRLNADIVEDGEWLARADFVWPQARLIVEYEGDVHRSNPAQWRADLTRTQILEDRGWRVMRITAADLSRPDLRARLVERIRRALAARSAR